MAMKKTTPPTSGIMKYSPIKTKVKGATGSGSTVASRGTASAQKQTTTSNKPATTQKQPTKRPSTASATKPLPQVTVTAKRMTSSTKPAVSTTGDSNKTYLIKDEKGKNVQVSYAEWSKNKGKKTSVSNDASGYPVMPGTGGKRYTDYTPLKKQTTPVKKTK
jgi:hypothetical protein